MTPRQFAIKVNTTTVDQALLTEIVSTIEEQFSTGVKAGLNWVNDFLSRIDVENASKRSIVSILKTSSRNADQMPEWQKLLNDYHAYLVKYCDDFARTLHGLPYPGHDATAE
jgi:hypothetical protein